MFFASVIIFSISSIQASDVNITDSSVLDSSDDNSVQIEYETDFTNSESVDSNNLSSAVNDASLEEDTRNQTEFTSPTDSIYYQGSYNATLIDSSVNATLADKNVTFVIDDVIYNATTDGNGVASINLTLNPGTYTVIAYFIGDDVYQPCNLTSELEILPTIQAKNITKYYKGATQYGATFFDSQGNVLANTSVNIIVNGKSYTKKTDNKGFVSLPVNFKPGSYKIVAIDPITGYNLTTTFVILSTITSKNLKKVEGDNRKFKAKFFDSNGKPLANKYVKIKIKGKIYKIKTNSKGKISFSLKKFKKGKYKIICYNRDGLSQTNKIKVYKRKASTELTSSHFTFAPGDKKQIKVKLSTKLNDESNVGKIIKIKIKGKIYSRKTDDKGYAYLNLNSFKKGIYKVKFKYEGNRYFEESKLIKYITILGNTSKTALKVKSTKNFGYGAHTPLKVAFTADNVPLIKRTMTFTIKGKKYTATTDFKGIASLTINLKVGDYKVNCTTYDQYKVNGTSGSFNIKVFKRDIPKFHWKCGKSFKDSSQKFKILVTDSKGKPISGKIIEVTIDSHTYFVKTNSHGYIKLKTYVPIGNYKVTVKVNGDNKYKSNSASKSVTVKMSKFGSGINEKNVVKYLSKYLKSSSHCQVGHGKIKSLVKSLTRGLTSDVDKAKAIFNYVRDVISYSYYYDSKYGAVGTFYAKKGNCVDQSHLLVSMYRTAGLKARYVHGSCKFNSGTVYGHVWTQVLIGKNWVCGDSISYYNSLGQIKNWRTNAYKVHGEYASLPF